MAKTHVGVEASELVLLESVGLDPSSKIGSRFSELRLEQRTFARKDTFTGITMGDDAYQVPDGKAMVITEVDWSFAEGLPSQYVQLRVFLTGSQDDVSRLLMSQRVFESHMLLDIKGNGSTNTCLTTGFVVYPKTLLGVDVARSFSSSSAGIILHIVFRGYLVDRGTAAESPSSASTTGTCASIGKVKIQIEVA